ncbi:MAG: glycosyltransferase involved in cell wall biosynthesis [Cellvibrionaceae bacterium]|jgi:glycosyltransferase involved in cell wall biosynthesis
MAICGINAQLLTAESGYRRAGIHVYLSEVLKHLPPLPEIHYKTFTTFPLPDSNITQMEWVETARMTTHPIGRIIWEQLVWPFRARWLGCNLIHGAAFALPFVTAIPSVVTIFDLSFIYYPELYPKFRRMYLNMSTRLACKKAKKIIAISESAKNDIMRLFNVEEERVQVIYPGLREEFTRPPEEAINAFRKQKQLPDRFILHVGTLQPRKNLPLLIDAFSQANLPGIDLVFAGGKGWFFDEIFAKVNHLGLANRIHFPGYVPDDELPLWYAAADLLVFPSFYEGFGMPIIEAMGCGTPVLASNTSAMPEAVGEVGGLFDPLNVSNLAENIQSLLENPVQLAKMRELGPIHAKKFSWAYAGEQTAKVYLDALVKTK